MGSTELMYINFLKRLVRQRLLMHLLFWVAVTVYCFFVFRLGRPIGQTLRTNLGFLPGHMIFVYSLNYFLFPRYVLKGKFFSAFLGLLVILAIALTYLNFADVYITHYSGKKSLWPYNWPRAMYALFSIGWIAVTIHLVKKWYVEKEIQHRLEKEKLTVELQLLRSQLHPHFLFNTLNSLYAMTLERSKEAPEAVLQLSSLLRYILYECNDPLVPLCQEIKSLQDYIALEKMRFGDRLDVSLSFSGDIDNRTIAPLLFLPFVENSIKHGISESLDKSWISLQLHVEGPTLSFKLINSRDPDATPATYNGTTRTATAGTRRHRAPGLGLLNVQRRLDLLYPDRHTLLLVPEEDTYMVALTLTSRKYETEMSPR
jgi:sensor histidine kinase YesM